MLKVSDLSVSFGSLNIVKNINFTLSENQWLMIAGPNGAGKSTLVHAISQNLKYSGKVCIYGKDASQLNPRELAKLMGVLSQSHDAGFSFTVDEVVRLGRYAYSEGIFSNISKNDEDMIEEALSVTGMLSMRNQSVLTLSGGELQRTFLAQVLAQDPKLLILDEPSNHLDLVYQKQVFTLMGNWLKKPGRAVVSVVHDLSLAKAFGTHALLMNKGSQAAFGVTDTVLNGENLNTTYNIDVAEWMNFMFSQWKA